jgi:hypothetical protein
MPKSKGSRNPVLAFLSAEEFLKRIAGFGTVFKDKRFYLKAPDKVI